VLDLLAGDRSGYHQRDEREASGQYRHHDRYEPLFGPAQHQLWPEGFAFGLFQMLAVADQHDAVARNDAEDRKEAHE
jgi:hypothetical protein